MSRSIDVPGTSGVLLVEDSPGDARLIEEMIFDSSGTRFRVARVDCLSAAIERLDRGGVEAILLDLSLPDSQGLESFSRLHERAPMVPIVVLSGLDSEDLALQAVQQGAQDYLVKGRVGGDGIVRAISYAIERKRVEEELRRAKEAAEAADRAKTQFVAVVSHEIRSPMSAIVGFTEILLETALSDEQRSHLDRLQRSAKVLLKLSNDLLDLFSLEASHPELERVEFDLAELLEELTGSLAMQARRKGLDLTTEIAPGVDGRLIGDPGRLRQVLANLIGNALKFTEEGEIAVSVTPETRTTDSVGLLFTVRDTGMGIPAERHETIFESFTQADPSIRDRFGGTGLGLAVSRRLVELMGGRIWVESESGIGSRFRFTVELGAAGAAAFREPRPAAVGPRASAGRSAPTPPVGRAVQTPTRSLRILVVEDSADVRALMALYLRAPHFQVEMAENGRLAVEKFSSGSFDLVFMDMQMPIMDGHTATQTIRQWEIDGRLTPTPIVALTAHAMEEEVQRSLRSGCTAHLTKPVTKEQVLATIREHTATTGPSAESTQSR